MRNKNSGRTAPSPRALEPPQSDLQRSNNMVKQLLSHLSLRKIESRHDLTLIKSLQEENSSLMKQNQQFKKRQTLFVQAQMLKDQLQSQLIELKSQVQNLNKHAADLREVNDHLNHKLGHSALKIQELCKQRDSTLITLQEKNQKIQILEVNLASSLKQLKQLKFVNGELIIKMQESNFEQRLLEAEQQIAALEQQCNLLRVKNIQLQTRLSLTSNKLQSRNQIIQTHKTREKRYIQNIGELGKKLQAAETQLALFKNLDLHEVQKLTKSNSQLRILVNVKEKMLRNIRQQFIDKIQPLLSELTGILNQCNCSLCGKLALNPMLLFPCSHRFCQQCKQGYQGGCKSCGAKEMGFLISLKGSLNQSVQEQVSELFRWVRQVKVQ